MSEVILFFLKIPNLPRFVNLPRLAVAEAAKKLNLNYEQTEDLKLAVGEACSNCIKHAKGAHSLHVKCSLSDGKLILYIKDSGHGFQIGNLAKHFKIPHKPQKKSGGLGIVLIRSLMDEVEYKINPYKGTCVKMCKHLHK